MNDVSPQQAARVTNFQPLAKNKKHVGARGKMGDEQVHVQQRAFHPGAFFFFFFGDKK